MKNLAILYRAAQLLAHEKHNLVSGRTFFEDHEFLGELYGTYETAYDGVIERMIGLGAMAGVDLCDVGVAAAQNAKSYSGEYTTEEWPQLFLDLETTLRKCLDDCCKSCSTGTQNFLQGLADESEQRTYKLTQRNCACDKKSEE